MWKTQMGASMTAEKEATEEKTKVAVASIMHPAYRTTAMLRRTLASSQQQNADLRGRPEFSVSVDHHCGPSLWWRNIYQRVAEAYRPERLY